MCFRGATRQFLSTMTLNSWKWHVTSSSTRCGRVMVSDPASWPWGSHGATVGTIQAPGWLATGSGACTLCAVCPRWVQPSQYLGKTPAANLPGRCAICGPNAIPDDGRGQAGRGSDNGLGCLTIFTAVMRGRCDLGTGGSRNGIRVGKMGTELNGASFHNIPSCELSSLVTRWGLRPPPSRLLRDSCRYSVEPHRHSTPFQRVAAGLQTLLGLSS